MAAWLQRLLYGEQQPVYSDIEEPKTWYNQPLDMEGRYTLLPLRDTLEGSVMNEREWALPGLLAEAVNAVTAPGRSVTAGLLEPDAPNFALNMMGGGLLSSRAMKNPTGQGGVDIAMNAWHGTPNEIRGGFDISKIGTGEGAQAYGHGMYFGEARGTGERYARDLAIDRIKKGGDVVQFDQTLNNKPLVQIYETMQRKADTLPIEKANVEYEKLSFLEDLMSGTDFQQALKRIDSPDVEVWAKSLEPGYKPAGNLYKVDIPDAQIPKMLRWDAPLSQQPEVLAALKDNPVLAKELQSGRTLDNLKGEDLYLAIASSFDVGQKEAFRLASEALNSLGIPGVRYLDDFSRGNYRAYTTRNGKQYGDEVSFRTKKQLDEYIAEAKKEGFGVETLPQTSNFVVFDPSTVSILEKNNVNVEELFKKGLLGY
jgi:hypothetical protein